MNYYDRLQKSVDYIELNLKKCIDIYRVAAESGFSVTHFYRIFQAVVGESVKSYVQKRRLSSAAIELITSEKRLIDVAFDYGYNSQEVFTRAFSKVFGITPGRYRTQNNPIVLYEKVNIYHKKQYNSSSSFFLEPQIILEKKFKLIGMQAIVKPGGEAISTLWRDFNLRRPEIKNIISPGSSLGLCEYMPDATDESCFTYMACVEATDFSEVPDGMVTKIIPPSKYTVFTHKGSLRKLESTYHFIYGVWFPESGFELAEQDTIEKYDDRVINDGFEFDIYIPIQN